MIRMTTAPLRNAPAAALWDMDGTIIDSEPLWIAAETSMLARYGIPFPEEIETKLVGIGLTAAARYFQKLGVPLSVDAIIDEWAEGVIEGLTHSTPAWMPGARELLEAFRGAGIPNALVTMSVRPIAEAVLALLPEGTFDAIITGDAVDHEKPHPDPYLRGAAELGVDIEHCIAFEDSAPGARSAAEAGAVVVGIPNIVSLSGSAAHTLLPTLAGVDVATAAEIWLQYRDVPKETI